ncbi:Omp28-related outer membrane protein [candidate division KSB1 bacterium]
MKIAGFILVSIVITAFFLPTDTVGQNKVLLEQYTGTWCGWCPYGHDILKGMEEYYDDDLIVLVYHSRDELATETGNELIGFVKPFYPAASIDRHNYPDTDKFFLGRNDWQRTVTYRMGAETPLNISLEGSRYDETSREVTINVSLLSGSDDENLRINVVLTEDHIKSAQKIYGKPYTEIEDFYHSNVVRDMVTGAFGAPFTYGKKVIQEENREKRQREITEYSYSAAYKVKIDPGITAEHAGIVVFVHEDTGEGYGPVVQAAHISVADIMASSEER